MKARLEGGKVVKYNTIPKTLKEPSGTIIKANTLSDFELKELGFYPVVVPVYNNVTQSITNLHFDTAYQPAGFDETLDTAQECFVYDVVEKDLGDIADLKAGKIYELKTNANIEFAKTDWVIVRNTENSNAIPAEITTTRNAIHTAVDTKENEINALTDKASVIAFNISL
tara:strand:- start:467 stop:976 length:510 start_codon:yes stop_codon:yes gene_type:complete